jgi:hypothetical protein
MAPDTVANIILFSAFFRDVGLVGGTYSFPVGAMSANLVLL